MDTKIQVLIVEDEPAIARGLETAISNYSHGFEVIKLCKNGREGLEVIASSHPPLIFTDIRMPILTGLNMIAEAKKLNINSTFVIVTGYEEFEYARTAMKLGVSDYLLKPLEIDELLRFLQKFRNTYYLEERQAQSRYFQALLYQQKELPNTHFLFADSSITLFNLYFGSLIADTFNDFAAGREAINFLDSNQLLHLEEKYGIWFYPNRGRHRNELIFVMVASTTDSIDTHIIAGELNHLFPDCNTYWNMIISETVNQPNNLLSIINSCTFFAAMYSPFGSNNILRYHEKLASANIQESYTIKELCHKFPFSPTISVIQSICREMTDFWQAKNISQFQLIVDLRYILANMLQKSSGIVPAYLSAEEIISESNTYENLLDELVNNLLNIFDLRFENEKTDSQLLPEKIKQYLDQKYTTSITYKNFYEIFGYNKKYISLLFKETYGISPSKYVSRLRMDLAKQIIREHPDAPLKEVAEMSGFTDALYFSRVFKNTEGISPSAYQQDFRK